MKAMRFITFLLLLIGASASAATCSNCLGDRVVGPGPVIYACPICDGSGSTPESSPAPGPDAATDSVRPRPVVARIEASNGQSRAGGSGVLVASTGTTGVVLTSWHVIDEHRQNIIVHWPDGSLSTGRVVASDEAWDLAAVLVDRPPVSPVSIAAKAPRVGERLTIAGYGGNPFLYREAAGPCTEYLSPAGRHERELVELRATARQGDSGGPIFDERGELAGILFGCGDGRTVGPCSTRVRSFLAKVEPATTKSATQAAGKPAVKQPAMSCKNGRCQK